MNIIFRVDASMIIGTGHVMRCLILADLLQKEGAQIYFICRNLEGNLIGFIETKGYYVFKLSNQLSHLEQLPDEQEMLKKLQNLLENIDLVIVDHYQLDVTWEDYVSKNISKVMVIDDLANRRHACDLLLDQNVDHDYQRRYDQLVPVHCKKLLGPKYLLLRPEFITARKQLRDRDGLVSRILVFFGGSDPTNETIKALTALKQIDLKCVQFDVVVGKVNSKRKMIKQMCEEMGCRFHCQIDYLARLQANADLALGAGGITMWERCYLGVPSITVIVAENQIGATKAAADYGAVWNLGWHEDVKVSDFIKKINTALSSPSLLKQMSTQAMLLMNSHTLREKNDVIKHILRTCKGG